MLKQLLKILKEQKTAKKLTVIFSAAVAILGIFFTAGLILVPDYRKMLNSAGFPVNQDFYLSLDESTNIWVSVWLPENLKPGEKIPSIITTSRYLERVEPGWLSGLAQVYLGKKNPNYAEVADDLNRGYASVYIQSPGSCQSSGPRKAEYPPNEITAMGIVIDWIAAQPWSNKRVGSTGRSYSGTTADLAGAAGKPELRAVFSTAPDFNIYSQLIKPGGLGSMDFIRRWGRLTALMDANDLCGVLGTFKRKKIPFWKCLLVKSMAKGLKRPEQKNMVFFKQAMADHQNNIDVEKLLKLFEFSDQRVDGVPVSVDDIAVYHKKKQIEKNRANTYTRVGWMDSGVVEGALQKYLTFNIPQKVVIYPTDHLFQQILDPFGKTITQTEKEKRDALNCEKYGFFDQYLKRDSPPLKNEVSYYTFGEKKWHTTETWPPRGIKNVKWYFSKNRHLEQRHPMAKSGRDVYTVDFTTTTVTENRWLAQMGTHVKYGDRRNEDKKLLTYTTEPLAYNLEVTGSPTVRMYVSSTHPDGAFHVYLEDVGPEGRVSYLTEGVLRAIHRKITLPSRAPFVPLGVYHTYKKDDAEPLTPGKTVEIAITLFPISVVFKRGHSIRIAIAGHDKSMIDRYPSEGIPVLTFERNAKFASNIELPSKILK